jgi:hypothetical protein
LIAADGMTCICDGLATLGHWLQIAAIVIGGMWTVALFAGFGVLWFFKRFEADDARRAKP